MSVEYSIFFVLLEFSGFMYFLFAFAVSVVFYECHKKVSAENGVAENDSRGFGAQFGSVWFWFLVLYTSYIIVYFLIMRVH